MQTVIDGVRSLNKLLNLCHHIQMNTELANRLLSVELVTAPVVIPAGSALIASPGVQDPRYQDDLVLLKKSRR